MSTQFKRSAGGNTVWPDSLVQFLTALMKLQGCKVAGTIFDVLTCSSNTGSVFLRTELPWNIYKGYIKISCSEH